MIYTLRLIAIVFFLGNLQAGAQTRSNSIGSYSLIGTSATGASFFQDDRMNAYDITHLLLDITVQPKSTFITAVCNYTIKAKQPIDTFVIEFKQTMQLDSVSVNSAKAGFSQRNDHIYVPFKPVSPVASSFNISFYYKGNVAAGFFAGTMLNGLDYTASVSESYEARDWFPAKQLLNDKIDSTDIWITTAANYKAGSNGVLKAVIDLPQNKKQYRWQCRYPLSYYMPSVAVGNYMEYDNYAKPEAIAPDSILVQNFLYNNEAYFNTNKTQLDKTPKFIEKFSELYGLYPFYKEKYGHCQADIGGGMEHATMTTLVNFGERLVAHELAHQWFGDNVTCASWNDIWLNESFATYSEYLMMLYEPQLFSETAAHAMTEFQNKVLEAPGGSVFVPATDTYNEARIFDYRLSYAKGATALHNLRFEMQDDSMFFQTLRQYQQRYKNGFASTEDFKQVAEQISGKNLDDFFNQKIYGEGYPMYDVTYLKHGADTLVLQVNQTTSQPSVTPLFTGLIEFKILSDGGDTTIKVQQTSNNQFFSIYYPKMPKGVEVDPNGWILKKVLSVKEGVSTFPSTVDRVVVYPNPVTNNYTIKLPADAYNSMRIVDVNGDVLGVYAIPAGTTLLTKNVRFPSGVYFFKFSGPERSEVAKIVVSGR
jgi:aminopeptidase N